MVKNVRSWTHPQLAAYAPEQKQQFVTYQKSMTPHGPYTYLTEEQVKKMPDEQLSHNLFNLESNGPNYYPEQIKIYEDLKSRYGPMQPVVMQTSGNCMSSPVDACWEEETSIAARRDNHARRSFDHMLQQLRGQVADLKLLKAEANLRLESLAINSVYQSDEDTQNTSQEFQQPTPEGLRAEAINDYNTEYQYSS